MQDFDVIVFKDLDCSAAQSAGVDDACMVQFIAKYRRALVGNCRHRAKICTVTGRIDKCSLGTSMIRKHAFKLNDCRMVSGNQPRAALGYLVKRLDGFAYNVLVLRKSEIII